MTAEMACAACLTPLNTINGRYIHPLHHPNDHRPQPVPAAQLDTIARTCDLCGDPYPLWTLTGGDLTTYIGNDHAALLQTFGQRWAACAACTDDIDHHRHTHILDRATTRLGPHDPDLRHQIAQLHHAFLTDLQPGRTLITTTAWPPTTLDAHDLPKIRDRLTRLYRGPHHLPATLTIHRREAADRLDRARLYRTDPDFTNLTVHAAATMPPTAVTRDLIPGDDGLLTWQPPLGHIAATSWSRHDTTIHLTHYRTIGAGLDPRTLQHVRETIGWLLPTTHRVLHTGPTVDTSPNTGLAALLAAWLLISQQAADTPATAVDKTTRRRYARARRPPPDVRLIRITGTHPQPAPATTRPDRTEHTPASQRVWVTGHWRNQPYGPRRALRRPVYIHPFLRGPDNAPIKLSTTVRVLRGRPGTGTPE
ncbi:hypothetical protein [Mangrovihabitans endophyticus]|uniref:Uncharacterized protein n=1 Tax=Mangrovihabitans endophyticus TaxID=1751298 RepID=A0A8J3C7S6_9ACTN|nr:hypothetical protein [Mangrovihabitans endophyticus]GGL17365.1 hypothetical protein GCM10012284_59880 [Mangrovihabitans endophyticus]